MPCFKKDIITKSLVEILACKKLQITNEAAYHLIEISQQGGAGSGDSQVVLYTL